MTDLDAKALDEFESKLQFTKIGLKPNTLNPDKTIPDPLREVDVQRLITALRQSREEISHLREALEEHAQEVHFEAVKYSFEANAENEISCRAESARNALKKIINS